MRIPSMLVDNRILLMRDNVLYEMLMVLTPEERERALRTVHGRLKQHLSATPSVDPMRRFLLDSKTSVGPAAASGPVAGAFMSAAAVGIPDKFSTSKQAR